MSLYKRGDIWWSYITMDGVRYAKSTGSGNKRTAELIDQRFREELNLSRHHVVRPDPNMTFDDLATRFLANGDVKPYHHDRIKALLPHWGEMPIGRIHKGLLVEYRKQRKAAKPVTDTTVNRDIEVLRHILFWAVDAGLLLSNPLARVKMVAERSKPRVILSLEDEEKLLAKCSPHLREIVIAALDTGMRRGELLTQRWEHIDWGRGLISVTHSKTAGGEGREIPFTKRLAAMLEAQRQESGVIFTFNKSPILAVKTAWRAAIRRAGIRYYRFHDLRHSFNTRLMEAGVLQEVRKVLMGHSNREETNSIYTHISTTIKREAIRKLEEWVEQQKQQTLIAKNKEGETNGNETKRTSGDAPAGG